MNNVWVKVRGREVGQVAESIRDKSLWGLLGMLVLSGCSQGVHFSTTLSSLKDELLSSSSAILINRDAAFTNDVQVEVTLQNDIATEVYVTNDPSCTTGGQWQPMQDKVNWTLSKTNSEVAVYALFRNSHDGIDSSCVKDTIVHDNLKPNVLLDRTTIMTNAVVPSFHFLAFDTLSGVQKVTCTWPGMAPTDCSKLSSSNGNLAEGSYSVSVVAQDNAGNVGEAMVQNLVVDRTPPNLVINIQPAAKTADAQAKFEFTADDSLSGVASLECSQELDSNFSPCVSPYVWNVSVGKHKLFVRAVDRAGNLSVVRESDFELDLTAPLIRILTGPNNFSNSATATFTFDGSDDGQPISAFLCSLDGGQPIACVSPQSYSGLKDGQHSFQLIGLDTAGNRSSPLARQWTIDTVAPVVQIVQFPNDPSNLGNASFRYLLTDDRSGVASAECSLDGAAFATCDLASYDASNLLDGRHTFQVRGVDNSGNRSLPAVKSWLIDRKAPTLTLVSGPVLLTNLNSATFVYTAADGESGLDRVECRLDAGTYSACDSVTQHHVSGLKDGLRKMSLRAVDRAGNVSAEVVVNWTVDATGPVIAFFQQPQGTIGTYSAQTLGFTVEDASGVQSLMCTLNGVQSNCGSGQVETFVGLAAGSYDFVVKATDKVGNVSLNTRTWKVKVPVAQTQAVQVRQLTKVDIIVIIDNSGSMTSEMVEMGKHFGSFISELSGLDWQLGIITTDPRTNVAPDAPKMDGRLVELNGLPGQFVLNSNMDVNQASTIFKNTIQMKVDGSGDERGILTAKRAIQRAFDGKPINAANAALLRPDAALAFVIVSDAYDDVSQPEDLINEVRSHWNGLKPFSFSSLIVPESIYTDPNATKANPADPCFSYRESVKYDGRIYHRLSDMTGGIKGTECTNSYDTQLTAMGRNAVELVNSANLACLPIDSNGDGKVDQADVQVLMSNGQAFTNFSVSGDKLLFAIGLPAGSYSVRYNCLPTN